MSHAFEYPAAVLQKTADQLAAEIDSLDNRISPLVESRDRRQADLDALHNAIDVLKERDGNPAPEVDYSPADGEQAPRTAKFNRGAKVRYIGDGPHKDEVGEVKEIEPVHQNPDFRIWYKVRFDDSSGLITISEDKLRHARKTMEHPDRNGPLLVEGSQYQLHAKGHRWHKEFVTIADIVSKDRVEIHKDGQASFVHPSELA